MNRPSDRESRPAQEPSGQAIPGMKIEPDDTPRCDTLPAFVAARVTEPTAWLRAAAAGRAADLRHIAAATGDAMILAPLTDAPPLPGSRADRTCDRCGWYTPPGAAFFGMVYAVDRFAFVLGLCRRCAALECPGAVAGCEVTQ